jgi:hypothetical protein
MTQFEYLVEYNVRVERTFKTKEEAEQYCDYLNSTE